MARAPAVTEIEPLPDADRLEGFPHPRETQVLFGHREAERELAAALASGRMHHAWIIGGPPGIGKATLAYRFARAALAAPEERDASATTLKVGADTRASRQVQALSHPGLLVVRRPYDEKGKRFASAIPVDEVRKLRSFLSHRAGEGAWRVVIVDDANELNINAANALLKSLEEPPARTVFLLVASTPGRLLATIRSRCRTLAVEPLGNEDLRQAAAAALKAAGRAMPSDAEWPALARIAGGSAGRLLSLIGTGGLELNERIGTLLRTLPKVDWRSVHSLAEELQPAAAQARFEQFFDLLLALLSRLIRAQATGEGEKDEIELAQRLMGPRSAAAEPGEERLASFAALWERVGRDKAEVMALNLDRKELILESIGGLAAAAQGRKPA